VPPAGREIACGSVPLPRPCTAAAPRRHAAVIPPIGNHGFRNTPACVTSSRPPSSRREPRPALSRAARPRPPAPGSPAGPRRRYIIRLPARRREPRTGAGSLARSGRQRTAHSAPEPARQLRRRQSPRQHPSTMQRVCRRTPPEIRSRTCLIHGAEDEPSIAPRISVSFHTPDSCSGQPCEFLARLTGRNITPDRLGSTAAPRTASASPRPGPRPLRINQPSQHSPLPATSDIDLTRRSPTRNDPSPVPRAIRTPPSASRCCLAALSRSTLYSTTGERRRTRAPISDSTPSARAIRNPGGDRLVLQQRPSRRSLAPRAIPAA